MWPLDNFKISQGYSKDHQALDLAASKGTPVKSPATGMVIAIGTDPKYIGGLYVVIREDHPDSWEYYTGHHSELKVKVGQRVQQGDVIALVGQTGKATGPHVHFQVRKRGGGALMHPQDVINIRSSMNYKAQYEELKRERDQNTYPTIERLKEEAVKLKATVAELERDRDQNLYPEIERLRASKADPDAIALKELIKKVVKE